MTLRVEPSGASCGALIYGADLFPGAFERGNHRHPRCLAETSGHPESAAETFNH